MRGEIVMEMPSGNLNRAHATSLSFMLRENVMCHIFCKCCVFFEVTGLFPTAFINFVKIKIPF